MEQYQSIILTPVDKAILQSFSAYCEGLANYLGDGYEIALHSLENLDHSVIKIINGYYTGRKEGAPITDLALHMLENIQKNGDTGYIAYFSKNKRNEPMRSTTITIQGENGRIIGLMCINFYLNTSVFKFFSGFCEQHSLQDSQTLFSESYVDNAEELVSDTVMRIKDEVFADATIPIVNKNKEIISRLDKKGIFKLKDSVVRCAEILGISKNTVYLHIRNLREEEV